MAAAAPLCDFEQARAARVARNNAVLAQLVSTDLRVPEAAAPAPRRRRVSEVREPAGPPRRSVRAEGKPAVSYAQHADDEPRGPRRPCGPPRFTRKRLTLEELEAMTEEEKEAVRGPHAGAGRARARAHRPPALTCFGNVESALTATASVVARSQLSKPGGIDSGRGRRVQVRAGAKSAQAAHKRLRRGSLVRCAQFCQRLAQGGRIYDSALGNTCHWCRQVRRTSSALVPARCARAPALPPAAPCAAA
jgi:hypothetical protein